jgi:hypothetical protein
MGAAIIASIRNITPFETELVCVGP